MLASPLAAGCSSDPPSPGKAYVYDPSDSPVNIDTPALRRQKSAAGIEGCAKANAAAATVERRLPDTTLPCLGGGSAVRLSALRGPLVLNFWAQSCGPCVSESPILQRLHEAGGSRLDVIGVDWYDPQPGRAIAFADELGLTYPQLADPSAATRAPLRINGLPVTFLVDASGKVTHVEYGAIESFDEAVSMVHAHLGVDVGAPQ